MIELKFINARNVEMDAIHNDYMTITAIDSLHGVDNEFSSSTSPYIDGDVVNHIRTNPRTIVLTYALKTSNIRGKRTSIEDSLNYFNSMVKSKQKATLIETKDDGSKIEIQGIVTVPPYTRLSEQVSVQIQLYCPDPYWKDALTIVTDISTSLDMHYFPFDNEEDLLANEGGLAFPEEGIPFGELDINSRKIITNEGDVATGMVIEIIALDTVINPRITRDSYNWIEVKTTMNANDNIRISTVRGDKYITSDTIKDIGIANIVYSGNDWLQIETGDNEFYGIARDPLNPSETKNNAIYFSIYYKRKWQ